MSDARGQACFVAADIQQARDMLLQDPPEWPSAKAVDAAGIQLLISALRSGLEPPPEVRGAEALQAAWNRFGLNHPADAELSLDPLTFSIREEALE